MTVIRPFRPFRFHPGRVEDPGQVWAPPYDVIRPERAAELRSRHQLNIVRLTNPEGEGEERYMEAAQTLDSWIAAGILERNANPAIFVHRHRFQHEGVTRERTGFWALVPLLDYDAGVVLPHERTMRGPRADRLMLMRACRAQLSPIFFICSDPNREVENLLRDQLREAPRERTEFPAGERHEIWPVENTEALRSIADLMASQTLLIADGHHRYETALAYRDERSRAAPTGSSRGAYEFVLAYIVPEGDPGVLLLSTHRIVGGSPLPWTSALREVGPRFKVARLTEPELVASDRLLASEHGRPSFLLAVRGEEGGWLLRLRQADGPRMISSVALHEVFLREGLGLSLEAQLERTTYERDGPRALGRLRSGAAEAVALLAAPKVSQVRAAAAAGVRMPPKTTFFWPKVPTGLALHDMDSRGRGDGS